jgi:GT2 family glycosyltransferase
VRIGAAVLHYRFWPGVRPTLDAVLAQSRPADELVLVDNGSDDGSADHIRRAYPQFDLVEVSQNRGPVAGMNLALTSSLAREVDGVLLLPHDCRLAPAALERLCARLEDDERIGAVGPLLGWVSQPERIWSAGGHIHARNWDVGHNVDPPLVSAWEDRPPRQVEWLEGSGLLLRASAARATGLLDERFFYYLDEPDYLLRMRALGWRVECVPSAVAWQEPGNPSSYIRVRNRLGFLARHAPSRYVARELLRVGFYMARDVLRPRVPADRADVRLRLRAVFDFLRNRWGPPPARSRNSPESPRASRL